MEEPTSERIRRGDSVNNPVRWVKVLLALTYIGVGVYFLFFEKTMNEGLYLQFRYLFGILAIVYGIFRGWRAYAEHF